MFIALGFSLLNLSRITSNARSAEVNLGHLPLAQDVPKFDILELFLPSPIGVSASNITTSTVLGLKSGTKIERPDGSSKNSFPSGHTATAFAGAEFLRQEYGDQSVWYGIAGYAVATGTGLFRMYNNRHWLTDVAAGAGIGILSTKIAYWVNPYLTRKMFGETTSKSTVLFTPIYDGHHFGIGMVKTF